LLELAKQLDAGRIYSRDLPELVDALNQVLEAHARHPASKAAAVNAASANSPAVSPQR